MTKNDISSDDSVPSSFEAVTQAAKERGLSRRKLISTAAAGVGAMAFAGNASASKMVQGDNGGDDDGNSNSNNKSDGPSNVDVLNYALTLEHLENEFYKQGLNDFSASELRSAEALCQRNQGTNEDVPQRIQSIQQHEQAHVDTITEVINKLGGDPVGAACYEFGYGTPSEFLQLGAVFENTGVSAYNGAIHFFNNDKLATAGATIATVEGRHASYLNEILVGGDGPFPRAFDQAKSMDEIKQAVSQFIVEC